MSASPSAPPPLPSPPRNRVPAALTIALALAGLALLAAAVLHGGGDDTARAATPPPPLAPQAATAQPPQPSAGEAAKATATTRDTSSNERRARTPQRSAFSEPLQAGWVESFYPIYAEAQRVYGVNWLLLASIHRQETAFSSHPTTYRGLNSAGCCGGPMQFNVTNGDKKGRGSTWDRYRNSYRAGNRPARYLSRRDRHPSLYDDFDTIMAAAHLLKDNGATLHLDATAWRAAYDYYGHDLTGIDYANAVTGRALNWARTGFCAECADRAWITARIDAAWGAPVRSELLAAERRGARD